MRYAIILLALVTGCAPEIAYQPEAKPAWQLEQETLWQARNAALRDGRIKIGMTAEEFLKVWGKGSGTPKISESNYAGHYLLTAEYLDGTIPTRPYPNCRRVVFAFDNGVLESWHDY